MGASEFASVRTHRLLRGGNRGPALNGDAGARECVFRGGAPLSPLIFQRLAKTHLRLGRHFFGEARFVCADVFVTLGDPDLFLRSEGNEGSSTMWCSTRR